MVRIHSPLLKAPFKALFPLKVWSLQDWNLEPRRSQVSVPPPCYPERNTLKRSGLGVRLNEEDHDNRYEPDKIHFRIHHPLPQIGSAGRENQDHYDR